MSQSWFRNQSVNRATLLFKRPAAEGICSSPGRDPSLLLQPTVALRERPKRFELMQSGLGYALSVYRPSVTVKGCRPRRHALALDPGLTVENKTKNPIQEL